MHTFDVASRSIVLIAIILLLALSPLTPLIIRSDAQAVTSITTTNGSTVCPDSLGGTWSGDTCSFNDPSTGFTFSGTLVIGQGVTVTTPYTILNYGTIYNAGTMSGSGLLYGIYNYGGTIYNAGSMSGSASYCNGIYNYGTIYNAGSMSGSGSGSSGCYGVYNTPNGFGTIYDYCGVTPLGANDFGLVDAAPIAISCYTDTFDQSGIPTSGATWGVTANWGPFPALDYTGTGASISFSLDAALEYSYDSPVTSSGVTYECVAGCSGTYLVAGATTFTATYLPVTATSVSCSPGYVAVDSSTTCTATVTGDSPSGTVTFTSSSGTGTFTPSSGQCTLLSSGSCSVSYSDSVAGSPNIIASYGGDSNNGPSSNIFSLILLASGTVVETVTTTSSVTSFSTQTVTSTVTSVSSTTETDTVTTVSIPPPVTTTTTVTTPTTTTETATETSTQTSTVTTPTTTTETSVTTFTSPTTLTTTNTVTSSTTISTTSTATTSILVPTSSSVTCQTNSPGPKNNQQIHCQDVVSAGDQGVLQGTVSWSSSDSIGTFANERCNQQGPSDQVTCQADYIPRSASTQTISAAYSGDDSHASSTGTYTFFVGTQSSSNAVAVAVTCRQTFVNVGDPEGCTATILSANGIAPTGTISWSSTDAGTFSQVKCNPQPPATPPHVPNSNQPLVCTSQYKSTSAGEQVVTASYSGDSLHSSSSNTFTVFVQDQSSFLAQNAAKIGAILSASVAAGIPIAFIGFRKRNKQAKA